jgi:hypothetical protein
MGDKKEDASRLLKATKEKVEALKKVSGMMDGEETNDPTGDVPELGGVTLHDSLSDSTEYIALAGEKEKEEAFLSGVSDLQAKVGYGVKHEAEEAVLPKHQHPSVAGSSGVSVVDVGDSGDDIIGSLQQKYNLTGKKETENKKKKQARATRTPVMPLAEEDIHHELQDAEKKLRSLEQAHTRIYKEMSENIDDSALKHTYSAAIPDEEIPSPPQALQDHSLTERRYQATR